MGGHQAWELSGLGHLHQQNEVCLGVGVIVPFVLRRESHFIIAREARRADFANTFNYLSSLSPCNSTLSCALS